MPATGLGDEFWGHFYRVDHEKYTFEKLTEVVRKSGLQTKLGDGDQRIPIATVRDNLLTIKTELRRQGFRVPKSSDKHAVCVWDLSMVRSCNSTNLKAFLVQAEATPDSVKSKYGADVTHNRTSQLRLGKRKLEALSVEQEAGGSQPPSYRTGASAPVQELLSHMDRVLTDAEVRAIDERLARFCYSEGLTFTALSNAELRKALGQLNSSYSKRSRLSQWTLRHGLLDDEYDRVAAEVAQKILAAFVVALISDGWSGVQKKHVINLLLATPEPVFMENVDTEEESVTGEYQAKLFSDVIDAHGGPTKVPAVVTDNATTMRKAWRLLRRRYHGLFTYGCAPHAFQLHAKDICALPEFLPLIDGMAKVNNWFARHLEGHGGRATLNRLQRDMLGKLSAPKQPGTTRKWNGQIESAEWHMANRAVLTALVTEADFDGASDAGKALKAVVLDLDNKFWPGLPQVIELMQPLRLAIHSLQGNYSKLSDVMGAWIRMHNTQWQLLSSDACRFSASTISSVKSIFTRRVRFLYHPVHLIAFALDPRYASVCKAPPSVIRKWLKALHGVAADDASLVTEYGAFRAALTDPSQADIWTPQATANPVLWWASWGDDWPILSLLARRLLGLPPSAASAERNWSTQDFIISKRRNRLAPRRAEKLIYIYFNLRSLAQVETARSTPGVTEDALLRWHESLVVRADFRWPTESDGRHMFEWDEDDNGDAEFAGMHGDEMMDDESDDELANEEADLQAHEAALFPFEPEDHSTPGEGFALMPCPAKLPHDLQIGQEMAQWFGPPFNAWHVGKIVEINRRRTKSENVLVQFSNPTEGETQSRMVADPDTYGANKLWVLLRPIPIDLSDNDSSPPNSEEEGDSS